MSYITDDNNQLVSLARMGDKQAQDKLIENNMGLIWNIVKKFGNRGYEQDDLFQIGAIGLVRAVNKFDFDFNTKFSTYAVPMIIGEIKRFLRDDGIIKVSRSVKQVSSKAKYAKEMLSKELGREPTLKEIAEKLCIAPEELAAAIDAAATPEYLHANAYENDNNSIRLIDMVNVETKNENEIVNDIVLNQILSHLDEREKKIIILRYFKECTQTQVSNLLGISQVQVSRLEKKVLEKIRTKMNAC